MTGIMLGLVMYQLVYRLKSSYVLPCSLFGILLLFYCALLVTGTSLQDARDFGWIAPLTQPGAYILHCLDKALVYGWMDRWMDRKMER